jgi:hypothetical protein
LWAQVEFFFPADEVGQPSRMESKTLRQHSIELVELCLPVVVVRKSGSTFHLADDGVKRAVRVLRGAEVSKARERLISEALQYRCRQPRLANACLAGEQHYLAFADLCL